MPNSVSAFAPNAKVFTLIDAHLPISAESHPRKELIEITDFINVSTTIDCEDNNGGAAISFNDMDYRFWKYYPLKYLYTKNFNDTLKSKLNQFIKLSKKDKTISDPNAAGSIQYHLRNKTEIEGFRKSLEKFGNEHPVYEALNLMLKGAYNDGTNSTETEKNIEKGGVLEPMLDLQNLIWVFMMGRDGYWHPKFGGLITSIRYNDPVGETPRIDIGAKPFTRLFEYSKIVTGLPNLGKVESVDNAALLNQYEGNKLPNGIAFNNRLATFKTAAEVIEEALSVCNDFFLQSKVPADKVHMTSSNKDAPDTTYFRVPSLFEIPKTKSINSKTGKEEVVSKHFKIDDEAWIPNKYLWNDTEFFNATHLYNGWDISQFVVDNSNNSFGKIKNCLSKVFILDDFSLNFKPYQNLIRSNIQLGVLDSKTIKDVLDVIKKTTLCFIYCDGDGNLKIERPNFDLSPWGDFNEQLDIERNITQLGYAPSKNNDIKLGTTKTQIPADYDERYLMCKKDLSYIDSDYERVESSIVTRTSTWMQNDFFSVEDVVQKSLFAGKSESSAKTYNKFGLRDLILDPIVRADFFQPGGLISILDSYAEAMKMQLNAKAVPANFTLDQRPDLHVNRNFYYLDKGYATLITSLTDTIDFQTGTHTTSVKGAYTRPIGYPLINPFRFLIAKDANGTYILEEFNVDAVDNKKLEPPLSSKKDIYYTDKITDNETYDKILVDMKTEADKNNFGDVLFKKYVTDPLDKGKIVGYSLIRRYTPGLGFDNKGNDVLYFLYKEKGVGKVIKYRGWSHVTHYGDLIESIDGGISRFKNFTQLSPGFYNYTPKILKTTATNGTSKSRFILRCSDFNYNMLDSNLNLIPGDPLDSTKKKFNELYTLEKYVSDIASQILYTEHSIPKTSLDYPVFWSGVNIGTGDPLDALEAKIKELNIEDIYIMNIYSALSPDQRKEDVDIKETNKNQEDLENNFLGVNAPFSKILIYTYDLATTGDIPDYSKKNLLVNPKDSTYNPWGFTSKNLDTYIKKYKNKDYGALDWTQVFFTEVIPTYQTHLISLIKKAETIKWYKRFVRYVVEEKGLNVIDFSQKKYIMRWVKNAYFNPASPNIDQNSLYPYPYGFEIEKWKDRGRNTYGAILGLIHLGVLSSGIDLTTLGNLNPNSQRDLTKRILQFVTFTYGLYSYDTDFNGEATQFFLYNDEDTVKDFEAFNKDFIEIFYMAGNIKPNPEFGSMDAIIGRISKTFVGKMFFKGVTQADENYFRTQFFT